MVIKQCILLLQWIIAYQEWKGEKTSHNIRKNKNTKEGYTDWSKSIEKKVDFAAAFAVIARRGILPKEASIHTSKMIAIKIALREKYNKENYPI